MHGSSRVFLRQGDFVDSTMTTGSIERSIEAMEIEQALPASSDGVVAEIGSVVGAQIAEGFVLARIS